MLCSRTHSFYSLYTTSHSCHSSLASVGLKRQTVKKNIIQKNIKWISITDINFWVNCKNAGLCKCGHKHFHAWYSVYWHFFNSLPYLFIGICPSRETIDLHPLCSVCCGCEDQFGNGSPYHTWNMWRVKLVYWLDMQSFYEAFSLPLLIAVFLRIVITPLLLCVSKHLCLWQ